MGQLTLADAAKFCGTHGPTDVSSVSVSKRCLSELGDNRKQNLQPENSGGRCLRAGDSSEQEVTCFRLQGWLRKTGSMGQHKYSVRTAHHCSSTLVNCKTYGSMAWDKVKYSDKWKSVLKLQSTVQGKLEHRNIVSKLKKVTTLFENTQKPS